MKKTAQKVGEHEGLLRFTVGQRARIPGVLRPLYVLENDLEMNTVFVGEDSELLTTELKLKKVSWTIQELSDGTTLEVRIRHGGKPQRAVISGHGPERRLHFAEPVRAITPGQSAVFSNGDLILGGGIIV